MIAANWEAWYRALRARDPEAYRKAINYTEAVSLTFNTPQKAAAEYERTAVMLACELLDVQP